MVSALEGFMFLPPVNYQSSCFLHSNFLVFSQTIFYHFNLHFLNINKVEFHFLCLLAI